MRRPKIIDANQSGRCDYNQSKRNPVNYGRIPFGIRKSAKEHQADADV